MNKQHPFSLGSNRLRHMLLPSYAGKKNGVGTGHSLYSTAPLIEKAINRATMKIDRRFKWIGDRIVFNPQGWPIYGPDQQKIDDDEIVSDE